MLYKIWLTGEEYDFTTIIDVPSLDTAIEEANNLAEKYNVKIKFIDNIHSRSFKPTTFKSRYESNK